MAQTVRVERMESESGPTRDRIAQRFPPLLDPKVNRGHHVSYAIAKAPEGGAPIDVTIEFRQGYVNKENLGDLLMSWPHTDIGDEKAFEHTVPASVAKGITDYKDLWLCMVANQRPRGTHPPETKREE